MGDSSDRSIDVQVSRLRRKLTTEDRPAPITTVRPLGGGGRCAAVLCSGKARRTAASYNWRSNWRGSSGA